MKKIYIVIFVIICIVAFLVYKLIISKQNKYTFGIAEKRSITEIVSESGSIITNGSVEIYSTTNGIVDKIYVKNGDVVKEKQKLFSVKSTASPQEKAEAYSQYQIAKTALQQAENTRRSTLATVERVHDDVKNHDKDETFLQKETRTIAEVANDNAYDSLIRSQAQLVSAQINYYSTLNSTVVAPISGKISNISIIPGTSVSIKNPLSPSTPLLLVGELGEIEVVVTVSESDINKIKADQEVSVKFDAIENLLFKGTVKRFDSHGINTQGVAKFNVYITINDPDDRLKPGMNADVDITTKELQDVIAIPNTAIKPYQKGRAVRVIGNNGQIEYIPVKVGIKGKEFTQILEGLNVGQKIIISTSEESKSTSSFFQL